MNDDYEMIFAIAALLASAQKNYDCSKCRYGFICAMPFNRQPKRTFTDCEDYMPMEEK